jgi:hypothetical protein
MAMRKYLFIIFFSLVLTASCLVYIPYSEEEVPPPVEEEYYEDYEGPLDVSYFYNYLDPYGIWLYHPPHGYVWIPEDVSYRWRPYSYGRWVWSDYGWTWISDHRWGWIPFHYGRWGWDRGLGWFWVPDTVWGPAWVTWRRGEMYVGWAPLPPEAVFVVGVGVEPFRFTFPSTYWIFVEWNYFMDPYLRRYILPYERNVTIINFTVIRTNIYVRDKRVINEGIDLDYARRYSRKRISKYELRDARRPQVSKIKANQLEVYRPTVKKSQAAKPKRVLNDTEAQGRISELKIKKLEEETTPTAGTSRLKDVQSRELEILEESQQKEENALRQKMVREKEAAKSPSEKTKVEKEYKEEIVKLKKSHTEEKAKIEKRHEEEKKKVEKKKIKKKK